MRFEIKYGFSKVHINTERHTRNKMCVALANTIINITTEGLAILIVFEPFFFIVPR